MAIQGKRLYRQALAGGGIGYITYGWDAGVLGGVLQTKPFLEAMQRPSVTTVSMISSVLILGTLLGTLITAIFGMAYGRRTWIQLGNVLEVIGALICVTSYSSGQMIAGRAIMGLGNGFVISMAPIYVAEMAVQTRDRGRGTFMLGAILSIGGALAYWTDFGMVFANGQVVWRFPVAFQIVISFLSFATLHPLPDTPRWYYAKKRDEDGDEVLRRLYITINEKEPYEKTKTAILASLELEKEQGERLRIKDFFWDTSATQSARRLRTGMILLGITQSQGSSFIFYYAATVFQKYLGLPPLTASGLSGAMLTCSSISAWTTLSFIEKAGRRKWLIIGSCLQTVFLAIVTGLSSHPNYENSAAAAAFMFGFTITLGATWGPFPIVYVSELMPLRYRHTGFCLSSSVLAIAGWLVVFAAPISYTRGGSHGWTTWIWFLVFNAIAAPYVYFFCPETQGKTLEEIDLVFVSETLRESSAGQKLAESTGVMSDSKDEAQIYEAFKE